jgi:hypothetical protein
VSDVSWIKRELAPDVLMNDQWVSLTFAERGLFESVIRALLLFGPIKDDPRAVAQRTMALPEDYPFIEQAWPKIRAYLLPGDDGRLSDPHADAAKAESAAYLTQKRENGKLGGRPPRKPEVNRTFPIREPEVKRTLTHNSTVQDRTETEQTTNSAATAAGESNLILVNEAPDQYEQARDSIWGFWQADRRGLTKAQMLAALRREVKANADTGANLSQLVAAARTYHDLAGDFVKRFDRYLKLTHDGPVIPSVARTAAPGMAKRAGLASDAAKRLCATREAA